MRKYFLQVLTKNDESRSGSFLLLFFWCPFLRLFVNVQIGALLLCGGFFYLDQGASSCKILREYFSPWVINTLLYGNSNTSTLPVCTNQTRDKSLHNKYNVATRNVINRNWRVTRLSVTLRTKVFQQQSKIVVVSMETFDSQFMSHVVISVISARNVGIARAH